MVHIGFWFLVDDFKIPSVGVEFFHADRQTGGQICWRW